MDRRGFLKGTAAGLAAGWLGGNGVLAGAQPGGRGVDAGADSAGHDGPGSFDYIFLTDTHLEPELSANEGCAMAFRKMAGMKAEFAIQGGDHIFDALAVDRKRADSLFDMYAQTEQALGLKVHHTIGNHDHFGLFTKSGVDTTSPGYGKQMYTERVGPTYYSFDQKGYHFVVLDTIQPTDDRSWEARIDEPQLKWLREDLGKLAAGTPLIVTAHVPLASGAASYEPTGASGSGVAVANPHPQLIVANAWEVIRLLEQHNTLAVFQGHTHINEVVNFRGIPFITSGAVCGNWWHGTRLGIPEGFTVVSLRNGVLTHRYETYGWKTVDPKNT